MPFIRQDLGLDYLQAGFLVSAFSITAGFSQLLGGWLSDRLRRERAMALGLGGVGLSALVVGLAPSYYAMLGILIVMGVFAGFYHPSAVSTLTARFEEQRRGKVIALHMLGGSLGFSIGPFLGAIIATKLSWHFAYIFLGLPALIAAPVVLRLIKTPPVTRPINSVSLPMEPRPVGVWQVFKSAAGIVGISVAMQLVTGPVMSFVPLFLVDVRNLSAAASSTWVAVIRAGGLAGSLFGGWLADKWGRLKTIFVALIAFGPVVYLMAKLPFGIGLALSFVMFGWLLSMRETTMQTYLMDNSPPQIQATVFGIYFGFGQQGSSIIQPVAGDLMDMMGIASVFNLMALVSIGLSVLAVVFAFRAIGRVARQAGQA